MCHAVVLLFKEYKIVFGRDRGTAELLSPGRDCVGRQKTIRSLKGIDSAPVLTIQ